MMGISWLIFNYFLDVPWCKALYLDTALYLNRIGSVSANCTMIILVLFCFTSFCEIARYFSINVVKQSISRHF
jgi:hypothetical protein